MLTFPAFVELFFSSLFSMIDFVMVSRLNHYAIAGVGMTMQPFNLLISIFAAVNVGATALVAWSVGAKDNRSARHITKQAVLFNILLGSVISLGGYLLSPVIMNFIGGDPIAVAYAVNYMKILSLGVLFQGINMGITACLRGSGQMFLPMVYNMGSNLINVGLNYVLIYGKWGFPRLEVDGAAVATTVSRGMACLAALAIIFLYKKIDIRINVNNFWEFDFDIIKKIFKIGIPSAVEQGILHTGLLLFSKIVASLSVFEFAAHQIAINVFQMAFSISQAFQVASMTLSGQSIGAKNFEGAQKYTLATIKAAQLFTGVVAVFFIVCAKPLAEIFTDSTEVINFCQPLFIFMAAIQPVQSAQMSITGALRGAGDTFYPLYSCLFGIWVFRVGLCYILVAVLHLGLMGAWSAFMLDQTSRFIIVYLRFKRGEWKQTAGEVGGLP